MAAEALALHLTEKGNHYDLCADLTGTGDLQLEVVGCAGDGQRTATLLGTLRPDELDVLGRLLTAAATARHSGRRAQPRNARQPWTEADDERLRELAAAPSATLSALMAEFGRTRFAIERRLDKLGLDTDLPYRAA